MLAAVLLVLVVTVSYGWWVRHSAANVAEGWDEFYQALTAIEGNEADYERAVSDLDDLVQRYPDTHVAFWAGVVAGDMHLAAGCDQLFVNKSMANQELRQAVDRYDEVLKSARNPMVRERATFGLARATESLGVDLDKAAQLYREVVANWPNGAFAVEAKRRAEDLGKPATKELYDKFAKFDPKPAFLDEPGIPGEKPAFDLKSLPDGPVFGGASPLKLEEKGAGDSQPAATPDASTPAAAKTREPARRRPNRPQRNARVRSLPPTAATETPEPKPAATEPRRRQPVAAGNHRAETPPDGDTPAGRDGRPCSRGRAHAAAPEERVIRRQCPPPPCLASSFPTNRLNWWSTKPSRASGSTSSWPIISSTTAASIFAA